MEKFNLKEMIENLDEKQVMKYCKTVANALRKFPEYKYWSNFCKHDKERCEYCGAVFVEKVREPEVHHDPETLTEIVYNAVMYLKEEKDEFYTGDVINTVLKLHLDNEVSYHVLCECCHKITHKEKKI